MPRVPASPLLRIFRPPVALEPGHRLFLILIAAAFLVDQYDINMLSLALPQIQAELGIADADIGLFLATPRLGVIAALALSVWSDKIGRRRLLMTTMVGVAFASALSAAAPDALWFFSAQVVGRIFGTAEEILSVVVIAEELEAGARGWGLGMLAAWGSAGSGVASLIYAFVGQLSGGWRMLYLIGVVPILGLAWARRRLPETRRFKAQSEHGGMLRHLFEDYPARLALILCLALPFSFGFAPALGFVSKFLQDHRGFAPHDITSLYILGGAFAFFGNIIGGRYSDLWGRKRAFSAALVVSPSALAVMYLVEDSRIDVVAWIIGLFSYFAANVLLSAFSAELFPTSYRSSASGATFTAQSAGAALGYGAESLLYRQIGDHGIAIAILVSVLPLAALLAMTALPETARRELEEIAPERK